MVQVKKWLSAFLCAAMVGAPGQGILAAATEDGSSSVGTEETLISAFESGGDVKLSADITLTKVLNVPENKTVTLDLNGHNITQTGTTTREDDDGNEYESGINAIYLNSSSNLTVKDTSDGTHGTIKGTWNGISMSGAGNETLTLSDVTISGTGTNGIWNSGTLTVSNSTVSGNYRAICTTAGTCTINSGTYSATNTDPDDDTSAVLVAPWNGNTTLDINGGTFNTTGSYAIYKENTENAEYSETVTIDGATINGGLSDDSSSSLNVTSIINTTISASGKAVSLNNAMTSITDSTITCSNMNIKTLTTCSNTTVNGTLRMKDSTNDTTITDLTATKLQIDNGKAAISGTSTNVATLDATNTSAAITITEGTFGTLTGNGKYTISGGTFTSLATTGEYTISGGKFAQNLNTHDNVKTVPSDAIFAQDSDGYYELSTNAAGDGLLSISCADGIRFIADNNNDSYYEAGTSVTVEAYDTPFATFTGWYASAEDTAECLSTAKEYTTSMTKDGLTLYAKCTPTDLSYTTYDYDKTDTFEVGSEADLFGISYLALTGKNFSGKTIKLTGDITMTQEFYPICASVNDASDASYKDLYFGKNVFKGTFDGDGHSISSFSCTNTTYGLVTAGLIGHATNAEIKNLTLDISTDTAPNTDPDSVQAEYAAGLVAWANNVNVTDCNINNGTVGCPENTNGYAGGVFAHGSGCAISNSAIKSVTIGHGNKTGVVVGNSYSMTITNVDVTGVTANSLIGCTYNGSTITMTNCTASSTASSTESSTESEFKFSVIANSEKGATINLGGENTNLAISDIIEYTESKAAVSVSGGTYTADVKPYLTDDVAVKLTNNTDTTKGNDTYTVITPSETSEDIEVATKVTNEKYDQLKTMTKTYTGSQKLENGFVKFNIAARGSDGTVINYTATGNPPTDTIVTDANVVISLIVENVPEDIVLTITESAVE